MSRDEAMDVLARTVDWASAEFSKTERRYRYYQHIGWSYMEHRAKAQMLELRGRWQNALRDLNKLIKESR